MSEKKQNPYGYSFGWTQPYNITYTNQEIADGLIKKYNLKTVQDAVDWLEQEMHKMNVEEELERLEQTDELVSAMTTYPDAEKIISKVMGRED
jgi:hypothetical protein